MICFWARERPVPLKKERQSVGKWQDKTINENDFKIASPKSIAIADKVRALKREGKDYNKISHINKTFKSRRHPYFMKIFAKYPVAGYGDEYMSCPEDYKVDGKSPLST